MQVLKFGGSSLANASAIQRVAQIIREHSCDERTVVVCSACAGITNRLVRVAELVRAGHSVQALNETWTIRSQHRALLASIHVGIATQDVEDAPAYSPRIWVELEDLGESLRALVAGTSANSANAAWTARILSYGERASARIVAAALQRVQVRARAVDATDCVETDDDFLNASPRWDVTRVRTREALLPLVDDEIVPVVTGFIGATSQGEITTLGRNSSDFSAAIMGDALDADEVCLWTDVDGVYDRDPRATQNSSGDFTLLEHLSYDEALQMAERGAKVVHPGTIHPLRRKNIILRIRNTFRPEHSGTRIGPAERSTTHGVDFVQEEAR
jgi:bifunctional aspartokinase / homoserine dehydrogenase 1